MLTYSMGGPSIDGGAFHLDEPNVIRYTPPVPEFEVLTASVDPGQTLKIGNPGIPSVMIILEGSGSIVADDEHGENTSGDWGNDSQQQKLLRPGQAYFWPAGSTEDDHLTFKVSKEKRGPLKFAVAHKNLHISMPTAVNPEDFGHSSHHTPRQPVSPLPYMGRVGSSARLNSLTGSPVEKALRELDISKEGSFLAIPPFEKN